MYVSRKSGRYHLGVSMTPRKAASFAKGSVITRLVIIVIGVMLYLAYGKTKSCTSTWDSQAQVWRERCSDGSRAVSRCDEQSRRLYTRDEVVPPRERDKP